MFQGVWGLFLGFWVFLEVRDLGRGCMSTMVREMAEPLLQQSKPKCAKGGLVVLSGVARGLTVFYTVTFPALPVQHCPWGSQNSHGCVHACGCI